MLLSTPAYAAPVKPDDAPVTFAANIISGDEMLLNDGRVLRLEGIKAPRQKEMADKAKKILKDTVEGRTFVLSHVGMSRYGGTTAQVDVIEQDGSKKWLQGELLKSGFSFVYPPTGKEDRIADMYKAEDSARKLKLGIWSDYAYADIDSHDAARKYGRYAFVTGTITDAKRVKDKVYLDFGDDWRKDFGISIAAHDLKDFRAADIDPMDYKGKTVRIRGWIKRDYGPMITATHPAQIQILKDK